MTVNSRQSKAPRVGFVSLGCPKNLVDSERILTQLRAEGYEIAADYQGADLVVVNTCGFIDAAVEESLTAIGEALEQNGQVLVTGCLGVREEEIRRVHPSVLGITGPHDYQAVMTQVHRFLPPRQDPFSSLLPPQGVKLTPRHYAYLKISEGCNHRCSFCIIPSMRGNLVSRPAGELMREAENLVAAGVRELLVVSQDTSAYGLDLRYRQELWRGGLLSSRLPELASALASLGVWVRLHYVYPYPSVDELIPLMAAGELLPYLDMPLQHGSERVLRQMRRPAATEKVLDRIRRWREICPDLTLRSTFIVGFPGETEEEFEQLLEFLCEAQIDRAGCFPYSPVEGAAANELSGQIPEAVKQERLARFMAVQAQISAQRLRAKVGRELLVLVDEVYDDHLLARSAAEAPEVDGQIIVAGSWDLAEGDFIRVRVSGSDEHDLFAEPVDAEE
ncbi:MAG: 30S ribosomal protein S12 methylthiotransferase RimO [Gammaproteobacteria bacterium]|nr:30S ribosomal protein S12 methylthiotransferase RimO [Gammaproteobacteria bacterium]